MQRRAQAASSCLSILHLNFDFMMTINEKLGDYQSH